MSRPVEQRFAFEAVAELYERYRPGYPEPLFEELISLSGIPPAGRILEIGCGTGKATLPLARRGYPMSCLEPGESLARIARGKLARWPAVEVVNRTFEDWELEVGAFDLVVSAQAFHWVSPEIRFAKAAAALRPDGALAILGNVDLNERSPLRDEIDCAYAAHAPSIGSPRVGPWYSEKGPIRSLFAESGSFGAVAWRSHRWTRVYPVSDYLGLLQTHSDHRMLEPGQRAALHAEIGRTIERHDGCIEVAYRSHVYVATRSGA